MCPFFITDYKVLCCYLPLSISSLSSSLLRKGDFRAATETKRFFHTSTVFMVGIPDCAQKQNLKINPWFVTGFIDAEGCFHVSIVENTSLKVGHSVRAIFQISLHKKNKGLLEKIKYFFGVGQVVQRKDGAYFYQVTSLNDLLLIIEHLEKYPLITEKHADFRLFKQVVDLMLKQQHLIESGLAKIVDIKASMNFSKISVSLQSKFPKIKPVERPKVLSVQTYDFNWVSGFVEGEGCFFVNIFKRKESALGEGVKLVFKITQDYKNIEILTKLIEIFSCGKFYDQSSKVKVKDFMVTGITNITQKIIPFFLAYPLQGAKRKEFKDFVIVAELMKNKAHLNKYGLEQIHGIKSGMNSKRV